MPFIQACLAFIAIIAGFYVLAIGKEFFIPLVVAIFLWYLISALAELYLKAIPKQMILRNMLGLFFALFTLAAIFWMPINIISNTIPEVIKVAPNYQHNINNKIEDIFAIFSTDWHFFDNQSSEITDETQTTTDNKKNITYNLSKIIDFGSIVPELASAITSIFTYAATILIYLLFLLFEQNSFSRKVTIMSKNHDQEQWLRQILSNIYCRIKTYIWVKTLTSFITGMASYIIMKIVGLDFAVFWAVIIFFLNFIPNIGSIVGTIFPALLSLVQFETLYPFIMVVGGIATIQIVIGNLLEPKIMGSSLNLSSIVILLSLVLWGNIWGIIGMFLCVPLTVVIAIILAEFPATRWIAILLSSDGKIAEQTISNKQTS